MAFIVRRGTNGVQLACVQAINDGRKAKASAVVIGYGSATLVAGTATVTDPGVSAASVVVGSLTTPGGTLGAAYKWVPAAGSFAVTAVSTAGATVATDTSTLAYSYETPCFHGDKTASAEVGDFAVPTEVLLTVSATNAVDLPTSIALANQIETVCNLHFADSVAHSAADTVNTVSTAAAVDLPTTEALLNACKTSFNAHLTQSGCHVTNDATNAVAAANATDLPSSEALAIALKTAINAHMSSAPVGESIRIIAD